MEPTQESMAGPFYLSDRITEFNNDQGRIGLYGMRGLIAHYGFFERNQAESIRDLLNMAWCNGYAHAMQSITAQGND